MKRFAGAAKPHSWWRMKLTMQLNGGLGSRSATGGTIHAGGCPSTFGASWPPFTSSLKANRVTVERLHGSGSTTVIACGGAMSIGGRRSDEANAKGK
jgi:hypothetical protein